MVAAKELHLLQNLQSHKPMRCDKIQSCISISSHNKYILTEIQITLLVCFFFYQTVMHFPQVGHQLNVHVAAMLQVHFMEKLKQIVQYDVRSNLFIF